MPSAPKQPTFVLQQQLLAAATDSLLFFECVPESMTARTASFGLEEQSGMVAACLPGSVFPHVDAFGGILFCVAKSELNMTPTCYANNTRRPCLICAMFTQ